MTLGRTRIGLLLAWLATVALGSGATAQQAPEAEDTGPGSITFVGRNSLGAANGEFTEWRFTEVRIDPASPQTSFVVVEVDVASLDTGIGLRDSDLRSASFFDVEKYPTATVRVHDVKPDGESERGNPRYTATFDIRIKDEERSLEGSFELIDRKRVQGELVLDRTDFGVGGPRRSWNPFSVHDDVTVRFDAKLPRV